MSNLVKYAERELEILDQKVPDSIVVPFKKEILALVDAFGESGQSGGSAPYTASAIVSAIKNLLLYKPICDITGDNNEWVKLDYTEDLSFQNRRCYGLFKDSDGNCRYLDAIIWQGPEEYDTFTGQVYIDDKGFKLIDSRQKVKFPFKPKSFYVDVIYVPITEKEAEERDLHYTKDGDGSCYYTILKDLKQLDAVFEYYVK